MKQVIIIVALLTLMAGAVQAATINVPADQATIQAGINAAVSGVDEVVVAPGTYVEAIDFLGKAITLRSASGNPADTIIDATGVVDPGDGLPVVRCDNGETAATVLNGFTLTGGTGDTGLWPGEFVVGGGMVNSGASPTVSHCIFSSNSAEYGGGMFNFSNSNPMVTNCIFIGNTASMWGGGMDNETNSSPTVTHCTFSGNTAVAGGGMYNYSNSNPTVTNCILWGNFPSEMSNNGSSPTVRFSDVQGGLPASAIDGGGNIDVDPLFVDADGADNIAGTEDDNLRLQADSLCIDAGDSTPLTNGNITLDLDGGPRFVNFTGILDTGIGPYPYLDMGAYETPFDCNLPGDINCDGIVDLLDLALMSANWLTTI